MPEIRPQSNPGIPGNRMDRDSPDPSQARRHPRGNAAAGNRKPHPPPEAAGSVLDDLQDVTLLLFATRRRHQSPDGRRVRATLSNDLSQVFFGYTKFE